MRSAPQAAYIFWIIVSTVGLLQALASHYGWAGLSFFRGRPKLGYVFAATLIPVSYVWFFSLTNRNTPGLEGWQLFSRFVLGAAAGVVVVLVLSSLLNAAMPQRTAADLSSADAGLDYLGDHTYGRLIVNAVAKAVKRRQH